VFKGASPSKSCAGKIGHPSEGGVRVGFQRKHRESSEKGPKQERKQEASMAVSGGPYGGHDISLNKKKRGKGGGGGVGNQEVSSKKEK